MRLGISGVVGSAGHLAECPDLGPECKNDPPPVPYYHHVALVSSDVTADVSYGLSPTFAIETRLVLRIVDTTPTYRELDGTPKLVPDDIHHHDRTIAGPGDPWLVLRAGGAMGKFVTAARIGFSLPVGGIEPDPYALGAQGKWHEHIMLGTGTFMPIVGMGLSYSTGPIDLSFSALGILSLYENRYGFRAPSRMFGGMRAAWPLVEWKLSPYVTADIAHESAEIWHGAYALEGFNARTDLLFGAGLSWEFAPAWRVDASFRARTFRLTDAPAFDYPGIGQLSVSHAWDLSEAKDDQGH